MRCWLRLIPAKVWLNKKNNRYTSKVSELQRIIFCFLFFLLFRSSLIYGFLLCVCFKYLISMGCAMEISDVIVLNAALNSASLSDWSSFRLICSGPWIEVCKHLSITDVHCAVSRAKGFFFFLSEKETKSKEQLEIKISHPGFTVKQLRFFHLLSLVSRFTASSVECKILYNDD